MSALRCLGILLVPTTLFAAGCQGGRTRETVTFAVLSNVLVSDKAAAGRPDALWQSAEPRLARTIREINELPDIRFVLLHGNLIGDGRSRSLDRLKGALAELAKPYYVVLGPEGVSPGTPSETDAEPRKQVATDGHAFGRSFLVWAFRGHGFESPQPYWQADVGGGLLLVALDTAQHEGGKPGHVDAEQLRWLEDTLKAHPDRAVLVLAYHALVPLHAFDDTYFWASHLVDNRRDVLDVLARHKNVLMVLSASHGFAAGKVVGDVVHATVPAVSAWPLAYDLVRISPQRIECQYVAVGTDDETREAFDRLAADKTVRALFGGAERSEEQIVQVFGGRKVLSWNLATLGP